MATISAVKSEADAYGTRVYKWEGVGSGDSCATKEIPLWNDKCIQFIGTFDGATIVLEGSNDEDESEFVTLKDNEGNAISVTNSDRKLRQVVDNPLRIRPRITAGATANTDITAILVVRR